MLAAYTSIHLAECMTEHAHSKINNTSSVPQIAMTLRTA